MGEKIKEKNIFKKITRRRAQNSTILTFLLILFKEKKISKNFFSPPPFVFCYCFFLYLFSFSSIFTSKSFENFFAVTSWQRKKNFEKKKNPKKNQEDSTPFLLRSKENPPRNSSWTLLFC